MPGMGKSWVLRRASIRFRAFKTRLRKFWVYKSTGKIRKIVPWKYPWISQDDWDKFVAYNTSPEYQVVLQICDLSIINNWVFILHNEIHYT